jgi:ABC-type polysaccharide/polyol phosphate transport system ATPase subunit
MKKIIVENVSLKFRMYQNTHSSMKEFFADLLRKNKTPRHTDFLALKDVSLSVHDGERLGIIGRNGAGKSTLLRTLSRIYEPTSGRIIIDGRVVPLLDIGAGFHPDFTGRENIYFNGAILGYNVEQLREIESEIIAFAELKDFIDSPVKYYSTGMYMRLAFSLATSVKPDILILDELFAGGDASFIQKGKERMMKMIDRSSAMIFVSHDPHLLSALCNRFIWIEHGRVIEDGDIQVLQKYCSS